MRLPVYNKQLRSFIKEQFRFSLRIVLIPDANINLASAQVGTLFSYVNLGGIT
jgi:hypothetical protein